MSTPILATKLYIPPLRPQAVRRPQLLAQLNAGRQRKLTLISAPAGFGKTTLVSEWVNELRGSRPGANEDSRGNSANVQDVNVPVAWLSLDEGDNDPTRFLLYLIAVLQTVAPQIGTGLVAALQSPQPPATEVILTALLNELTTLAGPFVLVLDDYHVIEAKAVDQALTFLLEHLPPQLHLVIATREDPSLPLARFRARGQLTELRITDLRFTLAEAAAFLNQVMDLKLSPAEIAALEARTEGWVAGLHLAAISMQGHHDTHSFIESFTGSHRFVMDYLVEEVLHQQPPQIQTFLLRTSILDRLCGPLCAALLCDLAVDSQALLAYLDQANLFIIPLDNERRWYRYHQLFAELLRQRLHQSYAALASSPLGSPVGDGTAANSVNDLHIRASQWYEAQGLELEAFHHATAANDIGRAERLIEGNGMPLHFRGGAVPVLTWLKSLPPTVLDAWPMLWTAYASTLLVTGQATQAEPALQAAEAALARSPATTAATDKPDAKTLDLIGRIAAIRATAAAGQHQVEAIITYSQRALAYLHPDNLAFRTSTNWKLGFAHHLKGERAAASRFYTEVITTGQASGNLIFTIMATMGLASLQEAENQLVAATAGYRRAIELYGEHLLPDAGVAYLGLARIAYEWNDLAAAQTHAQQSIELAQALEHSDRTLMGEILLARLQLAQGDVTGAAARLAQAEQAARRHHFKRQLAELAALQVQCLLRQGQVAAAAQLLLPHELPLSQARVHLAQGDPGAALAQLTPFRQQMAAKGWADETLKALVLTALAHQANHETVLALQTMGEALRLAAPSGFIRLFVDEGPPMAALLTRVKAAGGGEQAYVQQLLATFELPVDSPPLAPDVSSVVAPLSPREVEVLQLIAQGLSNQEISEKLFLALSTVKGHNRLIFDKLQVQRRTEAVARGRALGLL